MHHTDSEHIIVGRIVGVHGVRGQVKVYSDCRPREAIFRYRQFKAVKENHETLVLKLLHGTHSGKGLVAGFAGIGNRDEAAALKDYTLCIARRQLFPPKQGEFYWADLIGLTVTNRQGVVLGEVQELFETGANDVMVVQSRQKDEILIPFIRPTYIEAIDLDNGIIRVDWEQEWSSAAEEE